MGRIFDMDNKFFRFMSKVADLCILNIICVVCCIPVITAGASITAMYYVTLKMVRNEEAYILRSFFKSFKQNFKQATIINLIMLLIGVVLYVDLNVSKAMQGGAGQIFQIIFMAFVLIYFILFLYVYPVLAKISEVFQTMHEAYVLNCNTDFRSSGSDAADLRNLSYLKIHLSKNLLGNLLRRRNSQYGKCL